MRFIVASYDTMRRAMNEPLVFEGKCWKFGHNIPTDEITPTHLSEAVNYRMLDRRFWS